VRDCSYGICCPWVRGGWGLDGFGNYSVVVIVAVAFWVAVGVVVVIVVVVVLVLEVVDISY
jgi:hypothetical protein